MTRTDDGNFPAKAVIAGDQLTNNDILLAELQRARHALAYLKRKIGDDAMGELLKDDIAEMTTRVRSWVEASNGTWQTGSVELTVPGPNAVAFHDWYSSALANSREVELRAGHPEHFILHPRSDATEVVENIGETELPWRILYHALSDEKDYPMPWDADYPIHFGMEILDSNGLRVGFTMHQMHDSEAELHMKLTTFLPSAAPHELVDRHLHHFTIEFTNWTRFAWLESRIADGSD